jgi:hypothetical protein
MAAFGRQITEIFRLGEERVIRGLEATDVQVHLKSLCSHFFTP